jgi:hypothetical protein
VEDELDGLVPDLLVRGEEPLLQHAGGTPSLALHAAQMVCRAKLLRRPPCYVKPLLPQYVLYPEAVVRHESPVLAVVVVILWEV